jgi:ABC-2 type transport system ATP-binding protein
VPRAALLLGLLAALLLAAPAAAVEIKQQTYRVDVRAPDELGEAVQIDTNAWVPAGPAPAKGWPLVLLFHGGGGTKDSEYDALRAKAFAEQGAVTILYSARGHGASGGQVTVVGPKEISDLFDVAHDALTRLAPVNRDKISLWGISQGGLHTNLGQVWASDPAINPYGIRFISLQPGNTPDRTFEALVDRDMVKLSFGLALVALYQTSTQGKVSPIVDKWIATTAADSPLLYDGDVCDLSGHDEVGSTMRSDLAARSFGCRLGEWTPPVQWSQAFDDTLFPVDMATRSMRVHAGASDRLYLSSGGHGAPGSDPGLESDRLAHQLAWLAHVRDGAPLDQPPVVYWLRDPDVKVEYGTRQYPPGAWVRRTAQAWPPAGTQARAFPLGDGDVPLAAGETDPANDPAATTAAQAIPNGTTLTGAKPAAPAPGTVADFRTPPFTADAELTGAPAVKLRWTPATADTQLVLRVFDEAPDGTLTLLTRGALGMRGAVPGEARQVEVAAYEFGALLRAGHRVLARVSAGDTSFYKSYPGMAGGVLGLGPDAALTLPLRAAAFAVRAGGCVDRSRPARPSLKVRVRGGRLTATGRARDRGCSRLARVEVAIGRRPWALARGTSHWRYSARVPRRGRLRVRVRAVDAAGNASRAGERRLR